MAKIVRKNQKVFAGSVPVSNVVAQFGSFKNATPNYSSDLDTIQALDAWGEGWASAVVNNYAPPMQDFNAVFYAITKQLAYIMQNGISYWNAATTYYIGSFVTDDVGGIYMSLVDDNLNQALTDGTKWLNFYSKKVTVIATSLDYTVVNSDWYIRWTDNPTAENHFVNLPAPSALNKGREVIVKLSGNTFISQLGVRVTGGTTIDGSAAIYFNQYIAKRFISNGTNWEVI
jgi:hypothetical protein